LASGHAQQAGVGECTTRPLAGHAAHLLTGVYALDGSGVDICGHRQRARGGGIKSTS